MEEDISISNLFLVHFMKCEKFNIDEIILELAKNGKIKSLLYIYRYVSKLDQICSDNPKDENGNNIFHCSISSKSNSKYLIKLLIKSKISYLYEKNNFGETPFCLSLKTNKTDISKLLMSLMDEKLLQTCIYDMVKFDYIDGLKLLDSHYHYSDIANYRTESKENLLMLCLKYNSTSIFDWIVTLPSDILNVRDIYGNTLWHYGIKYGTTNMLLKHDIEFLDNENYFGKTPFDFYLDFVTSSDEEQNESNIRIRHYNCDNIYCVK